MKIKDEILLVIGGILIFVLSGAVFVNENNSEWKSYQSDFVALAEKKIGKEKTADIETGIHQIWIPELKVVDRCKTCHMAIDIPGFENEKQPFATHPDLSFINNKHPFEKFGCTPCHSGQGYATRTKDAHGEVPHWEEPMLSTKLAKEYGFKSSAGLMEINCNLCHRRDKSTAKMENINLAKTLQTNYGCIGCHIIGKQGASIGPELTYAGGKHAEGFVFANVKGKKSVLNWHIKHFQDPAKVSEGSTMPNFNFSYEQARALSLLVMSWKKKSIPLEYYPDPNRTPAAEE